MNDHTEAVLDYPLIRNALQTYAVTPMGKALAVQLHPHADAMALDVQLRETSEMAAALAAGAEPPWHRSSIRAPISRRRRLSVFIWKACNSWRWRNAWRSSSACGAMSRLKASVSRCSAAAWPA